jgi:spermidine synthase
LKENNVQLIRTSVSLALLSVAIIAYQLSLIQILSIVQWYHFAYMVISVALLGFGAAGSFITIFKKLLLDKFDIVLPFLMILSGLLMALVVGFSQTTGINFDSYLLFSDYSHIWQLVITYLLFFLPFFFAALAIGLVFIKNIESIGQLYFANMLGSGTGGIIVIILMWLVVPEKLTALISILPILAGTIVVKKELREKFAIIIAISIAIICFCFIIPTKLKLSEYKSLSKTLNLPDTKITHKNSSPYGSIDIVSSTSIRYAPGLSIKYPGNVKINNAVFINGNWLGPLSSKQRDSINYFDYTTRAIPYVIKERKKVLVLGAGTGNEVRQALLQGAEDVTAVEPNKSLINLFSFELAEDADSIFNHPSVYPKIISPRTFLLRLPSKYDLIILPIIGSFGGTSGLFALQEQYILTKEAFREMWQQLNEEGVISIISWIDYPYRKPLKILTTISEMLFEEGISNPAEYISAIKNWNTISFVIKRSPVSQLDTEKIRSFCNKMNFDPVILPDVNREEREKFNRLQDTMFYNYIDKILSFQTGREELYSEYTFNINPPTDNQPYFSQFLQWKSFPQLAKLFGGQAVPFFEVGYILLYLTFAQILIIASVLILVPLFKIGWKGGNSIWTLLYFSGLGIGYMFIEIIFIQKFSLYFGNVIYSAAAVVSLMLISSGIGSLVSQKISANPNRIIGIIFLIVAALIVYTIFLSSLLNTTIVFSLTTKIIFTMFLIAFPAFFMGMPFPLGLRLLASKNESAGGGQVPWAWGINGLLSVISAVLATIIAIELGFVWVMVFAAGAYCISLLVNLKRA